MTYPFFSPFKFLAIRYSGRFALLWAIPILAAIFAIGAVYYFGIDIQITGEGGLLQLAISLFTVAGGFFVAALTVLITNDHKTLNAYFVGENIPYLRGEIEPLTRKRFLSLLFGYLSFASFSLVLTCTIASLYSNFFIDFKDELWVQILSGICGFAFTFVSIQLFLLALLGLHYLADRLHRSDGRSRFTQKVEPNDAGTSG